LSATKVKELVYPGLVEPTKLIKSALYSLNKLDLYDEPRLQQIKSLLEALLIDLVVC